MNNFKYYLLLCLISIMQLGYSQTKIYVDAFDSAEISPHIQVTFIEGNEESVIIEESEVSEDKINIKVKRKKLQIYLDDAKNVTKSEKKESSSTEMSVPIYKGKILTITVTYKKLKKLTIKGEGPTLIKGLIKAENFSLKIYGESKIVFNEVDFKDFDVDTYGESSLEVKKGSIDNQKITAYGEGQVNLFSVENITTKITAFGEAKFKINASNLLKITAYGEAEIEYKGDATIEKGLTIGDVEISKAD